MPESKLNVAIVIKDYINFRIWLDTYVNYIEMARDPSRQFSRKLLLPKLHPLMLYMFRIKLLLFFTNNKDLIDTLELDSLGWVEV